MKPWLLVLAAVAGLTCDPRDGSLTSPYRPSFNTTTGNPADVSDLAITAVSDTAATLVFTEVDDGTGAPASYDIRFAPAPLSWGSANGVTRGSCASPMPGSNIGVTRTCTVLGLKAATAYEFQLIAFRGTLNVDAVFGLQSRVASGTTSGSPPPAAGVETVFQEDFESGSLAVWDDRYQPANHTVITNAAGAYAGTRYLQITYPQGSDGGALSKFFLPGYSKLYVRYYVRIPANFQGGTKLLLLRGSRIVNVWSSFGVAGRCPSGSDFFLTNVVTRAQSTLPLRFYSYYIGMAREADGVTCWGRYGDAVDPPTPAASYVLPLDVSRDVWHQVEFEVQLNDPALANGEQRVWLDGVLRGVWTGLRFRSTTDLRLNVLTLEASMSETPAAPQSQALFVDNILVTTAATGVGPPPVASVTSVTVSPATVSLSVGAMKQLSAVVKDAGGLVLTGRSLTWTSGNLGVATVSSSGQVTSVAAGSAAITVTIAPPATVGDLRIGGTTDSSVTLAFTEVSDGAGGAASYDIRSGVGSSLNWGAAPSVTRGSCAT